MTTETLTIAEAARRMGVPSSVLHRRVLKGEVPSVTVQGYAGIRVPAYLTEPAVEGI